MNVLYIGGTGEISYACVLASVEAGHRCTVFNRGRSAEPLPQGVVQIHGDLSDNSAYHALGRHHFDVVCQFKAYTPADVQRDADVFAGRCQQYVFISSASAYQKPPMHWLITEEVPLANPFWPYSQAKADAEERLMDLHRLDKLPVTIVRPSHTHRRNYPGTFVPGTVHAWRLLNGRPVVLHGDGTSLWTITRAEDFAAAFVRLLGHPQALGQAFHITSDRAFTWEQIYTAAADALGVEPRFVHVPTQTLVRINPAWAGPLLGDKAWSTVFDNSKLKRVVGEFECRIDLHQGMRLAAPHVKRQVQSAVLDQELHTLLDRIVADQHRVADSNFR